MSRVVVISVGWEQEPLIQKLTGAGHELFGIHYPGSQKEDARFSELRGIDYRDLKGMDSYLRTARPDAIISDADDYGMFLQSYFSEKMGLAGPTIAAAQVSGNKHLQRILCSEAGILVPEFVQCRSIKNIIDFARRVGYPLILKPVDSRGSIGVSRIDHFDEIESAFYKALENSPSFTAVAEQYIEGKHFNVDGYCYGAAGPGTMAVSENAKYLHSRSTVNEAIIYGAVAKSVRDELVRTAEKTARALGYHFGYFHGEFIQDRNGTIYVTEMSNRGGGILIGETVVPFVSGVPVLDHYVQDVFGKTQELSSVQVQENFARIDFVSLSPGKTFNESKLKELVADESSILQVVPFLGDGDKIPEILDGSLRHVMIISSIADAEDLEELKTRITQKLAS